MEPLSQINVLIWDHWFTSCCHIKAALANAVTSNKDNSYSHSEVRILVRVTHILWTHLESCLWGGSHIRELLIVWITKASRTNWSSWDPLRLVLEATMCHCHPHSIVQEVCLHWTEHSVLERHVMVAVEGGRSEVAGIRERWRIVPWIQYTMVIWWAGAR